MARIRTIKQGFFQNEQLSTLDAETHILAAGLLVYADDEGYFNANPKLVESFVFPLRQLSRPIREMLNDLAMTGYIRLGECANGRVYGHVVEFLTHQRVSHAKPSEIKGLEITWNDSGKFRNGSGKLRNDSALNRTELNRTEQNGIELVSENSLHAQVRTFIKQCISHATGLNPAPWDSKDAKFLKRVLDANPSWGFDTYKRLIQNKFRSDEPRGDPPWKWLPQLSKYADGPLDRFGKLASNGNEISTENKPSYADQLIANSVRKLQGAEETHGRIEAPVLGPRRG